MCRIISCSAPDYVGDLCSRHYNRLRTTGTTDDGKRARAPLSERLWRHVDVGGEDECWPWTSKSVIKGYGTISTGGRRGKKLLSHRATWIVTHGEIPESDGYHGTVVMHTCDNRLCCNPKHLRLGTQAENVRDMDKKGRRKTFAHKGEAHHNSRFTEKDVRYIRTSPLRNVDLAREFGCTRQAIGFIRRRISWRHLT